MINTSKYSILTFFPLNLFMQFKKAPNLYFLLISFLQTIRSISISGGKSVQAVPLIMVVIVSMIKDAFEDYKRHQSDGKENGAEAQVYENGAMMKKKWKDIHVGNIVRVDND